MNGNLIADRSQVRIPVGAIALEGDLEVPESAAGLVLFAHGSGSGRHSPRNRSVAESLRAAGFATLLFDLLTEAGISDPRLHTLAARLRQAEAA